MKKVSKKVSEKVSETKLVEGKYTSLNGNMLQKIKGGLQPINGSTDNACSGGCGSMTGW